MNVDVGDQIEVYLDEMPMFTSATAVVLEKQPEDRVVAKVKDNNRTGNFAYRSLYPRNEMVRQLMCWSK